MTHRDMGRKYVICRRFTAIFTRHIIILQTAAAAAEIGLQATVYKTLSLYYVTLNPHK